MKRRLEIAFAGAALFGCSTSTTDNEIGSCGDKDATPVEATFSGDEGYDKETDPRVLAQRLKDEAEAEEADGDNLIYRRFVGLGHVVCESEAEGVYYLTAKGLELSDPPAAESPG